MLAMEKAGADIVELGFVVVLMCTLIFIVVASVPFSDPLADGASIQFANTIAVEHNISYRGSHWPHSVVGACSRV